MFKIQFSFVDLIAFFAFKFSFLLNCLFIYVSFCFFLRYIIADTETALRSANKFKFNGNFHLLLNVTYMSFCSKGLKKLVVQCNLLSTDHELIPAGCKRPYCSAEGVGKTSYWSVIGRRSDS
jgi:hypothetical protein